MVIKKNNFRTYKVAVIASRFNEFITQRLLEGTLSELESLGIKKTDVIVNWVPGAFELPVLALKYAKKKEVGAVICLGAVIRGETYHFEMVSQAATFGIAQASLMTGKPVIFGVLTTDTVDQAYKRSEKKGDNKGRDAAQAAVTMVDLLKHA